MDKKNLEVIKMLRSLVSDVQGAPFPYDELKPELKVLKKIKPSKKEIEENKRSRSSILRCAVRQRRD